MTLSLLLVSFTHGITVPAVSTAAFLILFIFDDLPYRKRYGDDENSNYDVVNCIHYESFLRI